MNGMEIINSFKIETLYEFSKAIHVFNDEIYIIFKADVISIESNPSKTKRDKPKRLIKNREEKDGNFISHLDIEPIAYLLKTKINHDKNELDHNKEYDYKIEPIDEEHASFIEKNKNKILKEFLERKE